MSKLYDDISANLNSDIKAMYLKPNVITYIKYCV